MGIAAQTPKIELIEVAKVFQGGDGERAAVRGVSFTVQPGEIFGVIGESGAGKSTLLRTINHLETPTAGRVLVDGVDPASLGPEALRQLRRRTGMIFQGFNLLSAKTVAENVAFPLKLEGRLGAAEIQARVASLLERVGLSAHARSYPAQISGGQKQRVAIARALACEPTLLLCDEATSGLDPDTTRQVLALIAELNAELGLTIILITHEMDVVRLICDRVAVMEAGEVAEIGAVTEVFLKPRSSITRRLLGWGQAMAGDGPGRRLRISCGGPTADVPFLSRVAQDTGVAIRLLSGRVDDLKNGRHGQFVVALEGEGVETAILQLRETGLVVEEVAA